MPQSASNAKIAIGLCTYKRPALLETCLRSIGRLVHPENVELCIIVVDNDGKGTARHVVETFIGNSDISVYYDVEQRRGIPFARNNVLNRARQLGITALAFIDDDEYVDEKWLVNLWTYYVNSDADVVRGFVKTVYPAETPAWIIKGGFHQRRKYATGTLFTWAATNNVLFDFKKIVIEQGLLFDNRFLLTGGSDDDFFRRSYDKGSIIRFVDNAVVYEVLSPDRMSLLYFLKRKWRVKNKVFSPTPVGGKKFQLILNESRLLFRAGFFLLVNMFNGRHVLAKGLGEIIVRVARICSLIGIHIKWNEYK